MATIQPARDLGDGLVLRWSTEQDIDRVGELAADVFRDADQPPNQRQIAWVRDMGRGRHPLSGPDRGVFVEDTRSGKVVASLWLLPQAWSYEGIRFGVGRPEQVATHPDYRKRGLVRALFEAFHARSAAEGELAQVITGITYFYRQFGYEYALDLGGNRTVMFSDIPKLKDGETEAYRLRAATTDDIALIMQLYERERKRSVVSTEIPEAYWRWVLDGVNHDWGESWMPCVIETADSRPCGYVVVTSRRWASSVYIGNIGLVDGFGYVNLIRPLLRMLRDLAPQVPMAAGRDAVEPDQLRFGLGAEHPLYDALARWLGARVEPPYAWYVRVPDLPGFVRHIAPALEQRLPGSAAEGYTGQIPIDFYRGGLRMVWEQGKLTAAEHWERPAHSNIPGAGMPPLVFLQLLFGRRDLDELRYIFPDVWAADELVPVLNALFPRRYSLAIPLD